MSTLPAAVPESSSPPSPPLPPLRVESLSPEGRGVARVGGKVVFISGALPGEVVRARRHRRYRRRDEASALEILEASPLRVTPPCEHYGRCGGCTLQHLEPGAQLEHKQRDLLARLAAAGLSPERVLPPVSGSRLGYRRRARLAVRRPAGPGQLVLGFRERDRPRVAGIDSCPVLDPRLSRLLPGLAACLEELQIRARIPQLELAAGEDSLAVVLRHLDPLPGSDLERLRHWQACLPAVRLYLQSAGPDSVVPLVPQHDPGPLYYRLERPALRLEFGPLDFVQVHPEVNAALVERVLELLQPGPEEHVVDLYCGLGNLSLPLATRAGRVSGYDAEPGLLLRARANAAANALPNTEFHRADLELGLPAALLRGGISKLLLDPPRAGAVEVARHLPLEGLQRLLYVSCNPATLARDAALLCRRGLRCAAAGVLDMFPHTAHCESLVLFRAP